MFRFSRWCWRCGCGVVCDGVCDGAGAVKNTFELSLFDRRYCSSLVCPNKFPVSCWWRAMRSRNTWWLTPQLHLVVAREMGCPVRYWALPALVSCCCRAARRKLLLYKPLRIQYDGDKAVRTQIK